MAAELSIKQETGPQAPHPLLHTFGSAGTSKGTILIVPDLDGRQNSSPERSDGRVQIEQELRPLSAEFPFSSVVNASEQDRRSNTYLDELVDSLERAKLKRLTVVGFGSGALLAMRLAAASRDLVRRLALVEPILKLEKPEHTGIILALEKLIPFGLPLSTKKRELSLTNYSHRVRCPTLILRRASEAGRIDYLLRKIPNARHLTLASPVHTAQGELSEELCDALRLFVDVPAKRSQKNNS